MVHLSFLPRKGAPVWTMRVLALVPLLLFSIASFAQDATTTIPIEEEGLSRNEIIGYTSAALGFVLMIVLAWFLTSKKDSKEPAKATHTPGMRISSAHSNDPYMRRKVVKKTS
jgi:hypothetical protein